MSIHQRTVSITATFVQGEPKEREIYQPGIIDSLETLPNYQYSGAISALEVLVKIKFNNQLKLWVEDGAGTRYTIASAVKILQSTNKLDLLGLLTSKENLRVSPRLKIFAAVEFPNKLVEGDSITVLGFSEEEGRPDASTTNPGGTITEWGDIAGLLNGQTDLWTALEQKQPRINGASGIFTSMDGKTVTIGSGVVTDIS